MDKRKKKKILDSVSIGAVNKIIYLAPAIG